MSMNSKSIAETIKERRSIRNLKKPENLTKEKIDEILKTALYTPSAFGMQSARMIVLRGEDNKKLWNIAKEEVKKTLPAGQDFGPTEDKLNGFSNGYGTILFFEEQNTVKECRIIFRYMLITFQCGLNRQTECFNTLYGYYCIQKA